MLDEDIRCYLGREVRVITINNEIIQGVLIKEDGFYKFSLQDNPQLKAKDIKEIFYLKS